MPNSLELNVSPAQLHTFANHPFHVRKDMEMNELVDSIRESGVIVPLIVRSRPEGGYEIISGHRRCEACRELGIEKVPVRVQELTDDEATILMVNSVFSALKCQVTLGAGQVGSESACRDLSPEEKAATLPLLTDSILRIVEQAAQIGGCFALEPVYTHTLGTLEALQKLKETVADPQHFHIIFDPVNVLTADTAAHQAEFWPGWCEVIGKDLACIHMKDALFVPNAPRIPTPLGEGQMDYTILRDWLHREHPDAALLRDEVILSAAQRDLNFIRAM